MKSRSFRRQRNGFPHLPLLAVAAETAVDRFRASLLLLHHRDGLLFLDPARSDFFLLDVDFPKMNLDLGCYYSHSAEYLLFLWIDSAAAAVVELGYYYYYYYCCRSENYLIWY